MLPVGDLESAREALLREIRACQLDGRRREVHAGDLGPSLREPGQVHAGAAADLENRSAAVAVKGHEPQQVVELFEMVLIEIVEKPAGTDRMRGDLEVVNVLVPVHADLICRGHGQTISHRFARMAVA